MCLFMIIYILLLGIRTSLYVTVLQIINVEKLGRKLAYHECHINQKIYVW